MVLSQTTDYESLGIFVPSLLEMCLTRVRENIDNIKDLRRINDELMLRLLEKCSPTQTINIEQKLLPRKLDTNGLWKKHTMTMYPNNKVDGGKNWKKLYNDLSNQDKEKQNKVMSTLKEGYINKRLARDSKQIKVIDAPIQRVSITKSYGGGASSGGSPKGAYYGGGSGRVYSSSSSSSTTKTGKLMDKVRKEHQKSLPRLTSTVKVTLHK